MEEYHHHSYSDESTPTTNYDFFQSLGSLNFNANTNANANASASPKLSARNSYAGDMSYDFSDVFGGPPKYMAFRQSPKQSGKYAATSLFESTSGISRHRLLDETPAFGYVRKTGINDDFYCDIFNGEAASVTSETSIASRPISRTLSPAQSPAGRIPEFKVFGVGSPLPKSRSSGTGCKESEYFPSGTSMQTYANICLSEDVQVYPSYQSSLHCRSPDIPRIHFGDPNRTVKTAQGALHSQDPGKLQLKSPNARVQSLFEPAESVLDIPPRLSSEKLCSTPRTASCADTSDDGWETSTGRLNKVPIHSLTKRRHSSDKAKAGESFEKMNSGFEKARLSASDVPFAEHQRLLILSPPEGSTVQSKLKSWRDWMNEAKGLNLRHESGSLSVSSSGVSSAKEIHANSEIPTAQVVANEMIGLERRRDSEASDDLGSYVIEIDAEKGETFGFLPVKEIQIDTSEHPHLSAGEESGESANDRSFQKTMADNIKADKLKSYKEKQSISYQRGGKTSRYGKEASSKGLNRQPSSELSPGYGSIPTTEFVCNKIAVEQKSFSATSPVATKENPLNESHRTSVGDPYSLDIPNMVKEVAERIEKWQCEKPVFFHEIPLSTAAKDKPSSSGKIDRKAGKDNREHIKKFELGIGRHKGNDRSMKLSKEKHGKTQEEGQPIDKDTQKTIEAMDIDIKQWASGKEGNLRALLSTLQYILWLECGWKPIPLIEIIEGVAVKKAYQKARLCLHPDKLQQKRATEQQKYIAKRVFHILQEAWTTFNSLDPF